MMPTMVALPEFSLAAHQHFIRQWESRENVSEDAEGGASGLRW